MDRRRFLQSIIAGIAGIAVTVVEPAVGVARPFNKFQFILDEFDKVVALRDGGLPYVEKFESCISYIMENFSQADPENQEHRLAIHRILDGEHKITKDVLINVPTEIIEQAWTMGFMCMAFRQYKIDLPNWRSTVITEFIRVYSPFLI